MIQNDVLDGAKLEGRMEGVTEGKILVANNMKKTGDGQCYYCSLHRFIYC